MRYATACRHFREKRPPRSFATWGPEELTKHLLDVCLDSLDPSEVIHVWAEDGPDTAAAAVRSRVPERTTRAVVLHDVDAMGHSPELLHGIKSLKPLSGLWCLASAENEPDSIWQSVFTDTVQARMSTSEHLAWTQSVLGGCDMNVAEDLLDRVHWDPSETLRNARTLLSCTERPTPDDFDLVVREPDGDYVEALIEGDGRRALRAAPSVVDGRSVLARIRSDLLVLWVLVETRPSPAGKRPVQVAKDLDLPVPAVERLLPLIRHYSRSSISRRLDALALVAEQYERGHRRCWDVLAILWSA